MEKTLLFVFNPKAGKGKIKTHLLDIVDIFNKGGYEVITYATQRARDAYEKAKEYESKVYLIVEVQMILQTAYLCRKICWRQLP